MSPAPAFDDATGERRILDAADELFARHGVGAVTMAAIRDRAGVSMRRLYRSFEDKPALVERWLVDRDRRWLDRLDELVEQGMDDGRSPVDAVFDAVADQVGAGDFRGCAFLNTLAELPDLPATARRAITDHKRALAERLDRWLDLDPRTGPPTEGDVGVRLGAEIAIVVDGAIANAALHRDLEPIERARRLTERLTTTQDGTR